jgi:hypothetical protein
LPSDDRSYNGKDGNADKGCGQKVEAKLSAGMQPESTHGGRKN